MATCEACGDEERMPYQCSMCGGTFCRDHRLPEAHDCPGLRVEDGSGGDGRLDSSFDDSGSVGGRSGGQSRTESVFEEAADDLTPRGGIMGYLRNNMTFVFLVAIWLTFGLQWIVLAISGPALHNFLFVFESTRPLAVWTWVTSVFAHNPGGLAHIAFNSIALYFFGPPVERRIGSKAFSVLFIGSGVVAGLAYVLVGLFTTGGVAVLGASGAVLAVMGVLTVLNPDLRVLLFFFIPMPLWLLTIGFAAFSVFMVGLGPGTGGVAHLAHLVGLGIGLAYGQYLSMRGVSAPQQLQFGGGRRGPGGGRF